jgi:hypothetical protein
LWDENLPYLKAFRALAGSRIAGFGAGPIPVSEIAAYARPMRFADTPAEFETLVLRVQAADNAVLAWQRANPNRGTERSAGDKTDEDAARFGLYIDR